MSRNFVKLVIMSVLLAPIVCNSHDVVMTPCQQMARPTDQKLLIEHLEEAGIEYQVDEEGRVRCKNKDHESIQKLARHILGIEDEAPEISGAIVSEKNAEKVAAALVRAKISFEVFPMEDGNKFSFHWQPHQNDEALRLLPEIID